MPSNSRPARVIWRQCVRIFRFLKKRCAGFILIWRQVYDPLALALAAMILALLAVGILDHYPWSNYQFGLLLWGSMGIVLQQTGKQT